MSELIVLKNIRYKVLKNGVHTLNASKKTNDIENGTLFVSCGVDTKEILGRVHKISTTISTDYLKSLEDGTVASPLILFCQSVSQANAMFKNLQKDRTRFNKLAAEVQKQKIINKINQTINLENTGRIEPITEQIAQSKSEPTQGKRLSLNNGIFKSNDNY